MCTMVAYLVLCLDQKLIVGGIYHVSMTVIMNGISKNATLIKSLCCYEMLHNQARQCTV